MNVHVTISKIVQEREAPDKVSCSDRPKLAPGVDNTRAFLSGTDTSENRPKFMVRFEILRSLQHDMTPESGADTLRKAVNA